MKTIAALILAGLLAGCASIPIATQIAIAGAGVAAAGLAVGAIHDCKQDGACKKLVLPP